MSVRHELSRFEIPNELVQEQAGQLQTGDNFETMGMVSYQHIFSPDSLGTARRNGARQRQRSLLKPEFNPHHRVSAQRLPRRLFQRQLLSPSRQSGDSKPAVESDTTFLHENFNYFITDPTQFDHDTPPSLTFIAQRPDLEQSAFVEDLIRLGKWTVSAGLRWDHYQLLLNQNAFSPRISVGRSVPSLDMVLHASYDRIFQTPSFENILISSSPQIDALSDNFLRLPVQPSRGNYYEGGLSQGLRSAHAASTSTSTAATSPTMPTTINCSTPESAIPIAFQTSHHLRSRRKTLSGSPRKTLRLRQLLLHGWQRLVSGHRRSVPRR